MQERPFYGSGPRLGHGPSCPHRELAAGCPTSALSASSIINAVKLHCVRACVRVCAYGVVSAKLRPCTTPDACVRLNPAGRRIQQCAAVIVDCFNGRIPRSSPPNQRLGQKTMAAGDEAVRQCPDVLSVGYRHSAARRARTLLSRHLSAAILKSSDCRTGCNPAQIKSDLLVVSRRHTRAAASPQLTERLLCLSLAKLVYEACASAS